MLPFLGSANVSVAAPVRPFAIEEGHVSVPGIYLDSGTMHPIPAGGLASLGTYLDARRTGEDWHSGGVEDRVKSGFAQLVGADPAELAFVQSTTAGEQLVIDALGLPARGGSIVTDTLHFFGSFWLYEQLAKQGMDVRWLRPRDGRITPEQYEQAIGPDTRLVSLSLVSTYNGFEQDLKCICEIAHSRGARVYADIIHAAGTIPIDLHAAGVDFAASASYKWLMGDFGLGFLYVRKDLLPEIRRPHYGYYQLAGFRSHVYPFDTDGAGVADMTARDDAEGMFAMGTRSHQVMALLDWSLPFLNRIGTDELAARRKPMLDLLHRKLPEKGFKVATPRDCRTPLFTCILEGAYDKLSEPLAKAGIKITLMRNRFRVCPSYFNTVADIERLIDALPSQ